MAIVYSKIFKHHKKADGTYNVKICVYHNKKRAYIDTVHYLTEKKLTSIFTIKDSVVLCYWCSDLFRHNIPDSAKSV
jgi:hypothetical protein